MWRNRNGQSSSMRERERERHPLFDSFLRPRSRGCAQCSTHKLVTADKGLPFCVALHAPILVETSPKVTPGALLQELQELHVHSEPLGGSERRRHSNCYGYSVYRCSTVITSRKTFLLVFFLFPCRSHLKSVLRPVAVAAVTNQGRHRRPPLRPPAVFELQIR